MARNVDVDQGKMTSRTVVDADPRLSHSPSGTAAKVSAPAVQGELLHADRPLGDAAFAYQEWLRNPPELAVLNRHFSAHLDVIWY